MGSLDLDTMKRMAAAAGFEWTEAELGPIRTAVERALDGLRELEGLALDASDPAVQYRMI